MEYLTVDQMLFDAGVADTTVADSLCLAWGAGRTLGWIAFLNPVACAVAFSVDLACIVYGAGSIWANSQN